MDRVHLQHTLLNTGFDAKFVRYIVLLYEDPKPRVRFNVYCSEFFKLKGGTGEGDTLSLVLFTLKKHQAVSKDSLVEKGIQHKIALFDDYLLLFILFIQNPLSSVPMLLNFLHFYSPILGIKVNQSKFEVMILIRIWRQLQLCNYTNI